MPIDDQYVKNLPDIYRDILETYPQFNSTRITGDGLAYPSLYSALTDDKKGHTLGQIQKACENMAEVGLMVIKHDIFACPTPNSPLRKSLCRRGRAIVVEDKARNRVPSCDSARARNAVFRPQGPAACLQQAGSPDGLFQRAAKGEELISAITGRSAPPVSNVPPIEAPP